MVPRSPPLPRRARPLLTRPRTQPSIHPSGVLSTVQLTARDQFSSLLRSLSPLRSRFAFSIAGHILHFLPFAAPACAEHICALLDEQTSRCSLLPVRCCLPCLYTHLTYPPQRFLDRLLRRKASKFGGASPVPFYPVLPLLFSKRKLDDHLPLLNSACFCLPRIRPPGFPTRISTPLPSFCPASSSRRGQRHLPRFGTSSPLTL